MAMFSGKLVGSIIVGWLVLGLVTGYVHWNTDPHKCFASKHWGFGQWGTAFSLGRFELRNRLINYDCEPDQKYDTRTQMIQNDGIFVKILPKAH